MKRLPPKPGAKTRQDVIYGHGAGPSNLGPTKHKVKKQPRTEYGAYKGDYPAPDDLTPDSAPKKWDGSFGTYDGPSPLPDKPS